MHEIETLAPGSAACALCVINISSHETGARPAGAGGGARAPWAPPGSATGQCHLTPHNSYWCLQYLYSCCFTDWNLRGTDREQCELATWFLRNRDPRGSSILHTSVKMNIPLTDVLMYV